MAAPLIRRFPLQLNATSGNGTAFDFFGRNVDAVIHIDWGTGVTAGEIAIEAASDPDYTGTWDELVSVLFSGTAPKTKQVQISGSLQAVRARFKVAADAATSVFLSAI